jgi:hypothetical protein
MSWKATDDQPARWLTDTFERVVMAKGRSNVSQEPDRVRRTAGC